MANCGALDKQEALDDPSQPLTRLYKEQFCQRVADGLAPTTAYREVHGISATDLKAGSYGNVWLKQPDIRARVRHLIAEKLEAAEITGDKVVREIARIAFSDVRKVFDEKGKSLPPHLLDDATAAAIASIQIETVFRGGEAVTVYKYKFHSKNDMLGLLGRRYRVTGDSESEAVDNLANALADRLTAAKRRVSKEVVDVEEIVRRPVIASEPVDEGDLW